MDFWVWQADKISGLLLRLEVCHMTCMHCDRCHHAQEHERVQLLQLPVARAILMCASLSVSITVHMSQSAHACCQCSSASHLCTTVQGSIAKVGPQQEVNQEGNRAALQHALRQHKNAQTVLMSADERNGRCEASLATLQDEHQANLVAIAERCDCLLLCTVGTFLMPVDLQYALFSNRTSSSYSDAPWQCWTPAFVVMCLHCQ